MTDRVTLTPAQQAAGVDRVEQNVALLSGAGCGKTFVLARRFAELLRARMDREDGLRRIVAVTFTDKAAVEIRALLEDVRTKPKKYIKLSLF